MIRFTALTFSFDVSQFENICASLAMLDNVAEANHVRLTPSSEHRRTQPCPAEPPS